MEYNLLKDSIFFVAEKYKQKGKEYGIVKLVKKHVLILTEIIDLMSVAPSISLKFSKRIEEFLGSRFQEISSLLYELKDLPDFVGIELSKENYKDILNGFFFPNVELTIKQKNYPINDIISQFNEVKFIKFKK